MRLLFDENISYRIVKKLKESAPDCIHVSQTPIRHTPTDRRIWEYAKLNRYTIVTFDEDFKSLADLYSFPPKVILLRIGNCSTTSIADLLLDKRSQISEFVNKGKHALLEIF